MNSRVVHLDGFFDNPQGDFSVEDAILSEEGERVIAPRHDPWQAGSCAEVILVRAQRVGPKELARLARCRVIIRYGIGTDTIDIAAAARAGIAVCNVPDFCLEEMADHALSLILALTRRLPHYQARLREGRPELAPDLPIRPPGELRLVTVGFGRIARLVHERAKVFGFQRAACDPHLPAERIAAAGVLPLSLEEALSTADILSLHCPLTPATALLLNADTLRTMKPGALVINTARGGLIDHDALTTALTEGQLAGAGLDVTHPEPLPPSHPLLRLPGVIVTPHMAWNSTGATRKLRMKVAQEALRALRREPLLHPVG